MGTTLVAQLNTTLRSNLQYNDNVNDIWGYTAPDGTEYAIVGLNGGVSFVSLADPDNPEEVARVKGDESAWRDMKTYGEYAYSVADQSTSGEGITAFDLTALPDSVTFTRNTYDIPGESVRFVRAHNLYIDTLDGVLLTAGGTQDVRDGGILMFDLTEDPMAPKLIGLGPEEYAHDVFVLNDTMYASELFAGELALYDVTDYANPVELGRTFTPFTFTHNAWSTADGRYVFTTDERPNAPVAAYDVANKLDIELLDEYRPASSLNTRTIPHNVHVIDEYLSISYYTDGLRVVDASEPDNMVEIANLDTWPGPDGGFNGAWGAYPYLPSGLTLVSDRQTGLYVIEVDYKRAARLAGTIKDAELGFPLNDVQIVINAPQENVRASDALGRYRTGVAEGGTYPVTFSARNYNDLTIDVDLVNGQTIRLDTTLTPAFPRFNLGFTVVEADGDRPIPEAIVRIDGPLNEFGLLTNAEGTSGIDAVFNTEEFSVYVSKWGYRTRELLGVTSEDLQDRTIRLEAGFMDDFVSDQGWSVSGTATAGSWTRSVPIGTRYIGSPSAPAEDAPADFGGEAYVTGNAGGRAGSDDVDGGSTVLTSPPFSPLFSDTKTMTVAYSYWFFASDGEVPNDDSLTISINSGATVAGQNTYAGSDTLWIRDSIVFDATQFGEEFTVTVTTGDQGTGHIVEAGFDAFSVTEDVVALSTADRLPANSTVHLYPNPSYGDVTFDYDVATTTGLRLRVFDARGSTVREVRLTGPAGRATFGGGLPAGIYLVELSNSSGRLWTGKAIRR